MVQGDPGSGWTLSAKCQQQLPMGLLLVGCCGLEVQATQVGYGVGGVGWCL